MCNRRAMMGRLHAQGGRSMARMDGFSGARSRAVAVWRRRRLRWGILIAVAALVAPAATIAVAQAARSRYEVPRADLFGASEPSASPTPTPTPTVEPGAGITGPLNFLLVGIDPRVSVPNW